ncbi:MAG: tetratricopeptide repeat protein, partial [Moraxellaceae bacterium]|nr:tetratricopeptide repeat protein [Moraxellaceae bacterium]
MMKKIFAIALLSTALISSSVFACGNVETIEPINEHTETMTLADGTRYEIISNDKVPYGYPFSEEERQTFQKSVENLEKLYQESKNLDYLSDKGLVLMYLGDYQQAKEIFLQIEKIEPNRYSTASNLGTTYELLGDNKNALKWIKKAVEINPKSHHNSEWIHVNILQAKIKGEQFYTTEFILKTDFGNDIFPTSELSKRELKQLHEQLLYQLTERAHFIKPKNKIMAELIYA